MFFYKIGKLQKRNFCLSCLMLFFLGLYPTVSAGANIIFDLGGVFLDTSYIAVCYYTGMSRVMRYLIAKRKSPQGLLFNVLNEINLTGEASEKEKEACDAHGKLLPNGFIQWFKGNSSGCDIINAVDDYLLNNMQYDDIEKDLLKGMVRVIFDPIYFAKTKKIYDECLVFMVDCVKQGHKLFVLSNLDRESWLELKKMLPGFFECFDGCVISSEIGVIKPDPTSFSYVLDHFDLNPAETVFIDDQIENLDAASEHGIYPILCKKSGWLKKQPDFCSVRAEFDLWQAHIRQETCFL